MLPEPKVSDARIRALRAAAIEYRYQEDRASEEGVLSLGLKKGQVVRDPDTGARYRIDSVTVWIRTNDSEPQLSIMGTRVYSTGRRDARSKTILTGRRFDLEV